MTRVTPNVGGGIQVSQPNEPDEVEASRLAETASRELNAFTRLGSGAPRPRIIDAATLAPQDDQPLPVGTRRHLEAVLHTNFSDVRLHASANARRITRHLSARAFAYGRNIWLSDAHLVGDIGLLAHELFHVAKQSRNGGEAKIERAPDDGKTGGALPADPAAARTMEFKGIAEYSSAEVPATTGSGPIRLVRAGGYILGPNAIQCMNGEFAPLYFVAFHLGRQRNEWVVGPANVEEFKATAEERANKPKQASEAASPVTIPLNSAHATEYKKRGVEPLYLTQSVPYTSPKATASTIRAGEYDLVPNSVNLASGGQEILYYTARNRNTNIDQWIVGPDSVAEFQQNSDAYFAGASLAYMYGPPHAYEAESARFVWGGGSLTKSWTQASHDPKFLLHAAAAHVPVGRIIAPIAPYVRRATLAAMIGTADAVPALTLGTAPKAVIAVVEGSAAKTAVSSAARPLVTAATQEVAPVVAAQTTLAAPVTAAASRETLVAGAQALAVSSASSVSREITNVDQAVERAFVEHAPTTQPSPRAPLRRVQRTDEAQQTRDAFGAIRDGYAQALQVAAYGQVHHAVEVQVLSRYPSVYRPNEINAVSNMRGIPPEVGRRTQLHNSKIREILDRHYRALDDEIARRGLQPGTTEYNNLVRAWIDDAVAEIDYVLGQFFSEQRATLFVPPPY